MISNKWWAVRRFSFILAIGMVLLVVGCPAGGGGNGDGSGEGQGEPVTSARVLELATALLVNFESGDADTSGSLTFTEAQTIDPNITQREFDAVDTGGNGEISNAELLDHVLGGGGGEGGGDGEFGDGGEITPISCDLENPCPTGLMCSGFVEGESLCVVSVLIRGRVLAVADDAPIPDAQVQALDINGTPVGPTVVTDESGRYSLEVPKLRDVDGEFVDAVYTLRVQAQLFQEFPTALRPALPIDVAFALAEEIPIRTVTDQRLYLLAIDLDANFDAADADASATLSFDEVQTTIDPNITQEEFDLVDIGGNGQISSAELDAVLLLVPSEGEGEGEGEGGGEGEGEVFEPVPTRLVVDNALTTVKLIALPGDTSLLGSISGTILAEANSGILVLADDSVGPALTGFSNSEGAYTIFNVPEGTYSVEGYAARVQLTPIQATVEVSEETTGVDISESANPLSTISGTVQFVNAPAAEFTSVILAVESTFNETSARGTAPPGLRVGEVTGEFIFEGVPDGKYVVLAAFENDILVRDPDQNIGGTEIVRVEVPDPDQGNEIVLTTGFKITQALEVFGPGVDSPEEVFTLNPVFEWENDTSEDGYELRVFDSFGNEVWSFDVPIISGSANMTHTYAGPELEIGIFYQFRVWSYRIDNQDVRSAISATEDLRGVFFYLGNTSPAL